MRQLLTRDKMIQKLTTIGQRTTFNDDQSPYRIVSYSRPRLSLDTICEYGLEETMIVRRKGTINGSPVLRESHISCTLNTPL